MSKTDLSLEKLVNTVPVYLSYVGSDLRYRFINESYRNLFPGDQFDQVIGRTLVEVIGEKMFEKIRPYVEEVLKGKPTTYEMMISYGPDTNKVMKGHYHPDFNEAGETIGFYVFVEDITDRKVAEENYKYIFDHNPQMMCIWDLENYRLLDANEAMAIHYEYSREELLSMTLKDIRPKEEVQAFLDRAMNLPTSRYSEDKIIIHQKKKGQIIHVTVSSNQILYKGRLARITLLTDVTEKLRIEKERVNTLETLRTVNQVGQTLTSTLDLNVIVQTVIDAATKITKASYGAFFYNVKDQQNESYLLYTVSGAPLEKFKNFPAPGATELFKPTFIGAGTVRLDDVTKDPRFKGLPEGHLSVRSYLAVSVVSNSGEVHGGIFLSHTETGKFTEHDAAMVEGLASQAGIAIDNARLYQKSQEALRVRDEFLSIASHELKTPLTSLVLRTQTKKRLLKKLHENDGLREKELEELDAEVRLLFRLNRLIDDMLDVSRIRTGRIELQKETFNFSKVIRDILDRLKIQIASTVESVETDIDEEIEIEADMIRIEQVIINLMTNAMKYGDKRPIKITLKRRNDFVMFTIVDRGIGIGPDDQKRIFSRFERAVPSSEVSGLGLGLSIAKDILEAHGGRIGVESRLGEGSTFIVELPLKLS